ncbi:MAG: hypothetical protein OET18_15960 [Desulfobacterales bacterium]|nr:hypothetical protein [Desulfobacterales bacterium]
MNRMIIFSSSALLLALNLAGCASDGSLQLTTGSIDQQNKTAAKSVDPACIALTARIADLRKEGTPDRIAKVAAGKTKIAQVKREALARMTELDKANMDFQQKCSTIATPAPAKPAATAKAKAAATAAALKTGKSAAAQQTTAAAKTAALVQ